jgi:hypothetical protein
MFVVCDDMEEFLGTKIWSAVWCMKKKENYVPKTKKMGFHIGVTNELMWYKGFSHRAKRLPDVKSTFIFNKIK